ncbi:lysosomal acid phosphatase-like isoform X5 [Dreissena polymorpha]|nr:lysosomal acid phosphatase-like isoform X2 [Dreissena polymorpha]XP_052246871.1 lysosomal acid phosphatase-like isoform X3 [Dreissena polymorpha]XP_052246873.1 lysosomal acid phosphatase-like isoform X4 [Dreissena polymorpha]XP_052246874.1 lysosomal acid phosphatase-like isoform X5 [Dreissena polymorpha]
MNSSYSRYQIAIESSDEDRCLMSAYSNLAGLFYPPDNESRFHPDLPWQPIPVHTRPTYEDNMLNMGENCPRYNELLAATMASHAIEKEEIHNKEFYAHVGNLTGWKDENISNIWRIADTVFCEKCHNLTDNPWLYDIWNKTTNQTIYDKLRHLESYQFTLLFKGKEASMLKGGPLLARWIQNMKDKITFPQNNTFKMLMYSGHDTTVSALLTNLGLFNGVSPQYASSVVSELHEGQAGSFYVNLFYKNQTYNDTFVPLTLPGCTFNCPYDNFIRLTKDAVPTDWRKQCGYPDPQAPNKGGDKLGAGWLVSFALAGLLVAVLIIFGVCVFRLRRRSDTTLYSKFDISS